MSVKIFLSCFLAQLFFFSFLVQDAVHAEVAQASYIIKVLLNQGHGLETARDILTYQKKWTAPLLSEISEKIYLDQKTQVLMYHYNRDYLLSCKNRLRYRFDETIFNKQIWDNNECKTGFNLWLYRINEQPPLFKVVKILLAQYYDLAQRLTTLHKNRTQILEQHRTDRQSVVVLELDIKKLAQTGYDLTDVTRKFLEVSQLCMIQLDVIGTRQKALDGLRTFDIDVSIDDRNLSTKSFNETIEIIKRAVRKLELAIKS
jgi:uncharacterized HAD superfamily protein